MGVDFKLPYVNFSISLFFDVMPELDQRPIMKLSMVLFLALKEDFKAIWAYYLTHLV